MVAAAGSVVAIRAPIASDLHRRIWTGQCRIL